MDKYYITEVNLAMVIPTVNLAMVIPTVRYVASGCVISAVACRINLKY